MSINSESKSVYQSGTAPAAVECTEHGEARRMRDYAVIVMLAATLLLPELSSGAVDSAGRPARNEEPFYPRKSPSDCYVLRRPLHSEKIIRSGNSSACTAILRNLNGFCADPPLYDMRRLNPRAAGLSQPNWTEISAQDHPDVVKSMFLASVRAQDQSLVWKQTINRSRQELSQLLADRKVKLLKAQIDLDGIPPAEVVYASPGLNEVLSPTFGANSQLLRGSGQYSLLFTDVNGNDTPQRLSSISVHRGDLWHVAGAWYVMEYRSPIVDDGWFVSKFVNPTGASVGTIPHCLIQRFDRFRR